MKILRWLLLFYILSSFFQFCWDFCIAVDDDEKWIKIALHQRWLIFIVRIYKAARALCNIQISYWNMRIIKFFISIMSCWFSTRVYDKINVTWLYTILKINYYYIGTMKRKEKKRACLLNVHVSGVLKFIQIVNKA